MESPLSNDKKAQTIQRMENNCHFPDLMQAFPYVENCWFLIRFDN